MGNLTDAVRRMLESLQITSAGGDSPKINEVLQIDPSIDLDETIEQGKETTKKDIEINKTVKKVKAFDQQNIGEINRFTSAQMGNLKGFVNNPVNFIVGNVFKKLGRGIGVFALVLIIREAVKFIILELQKPGRLLDVRFKRDVRKEIIAFRRREDQQKLRQGFTNVIITTMPRLRGGQNQFVNSLDLVRENSVPENIGFSGIQLQSSGTSFSKNIGRRNAGVGPGG